MDCNIHSHVDRLNPPMSTRIESNGMFYLVSGDYSDRFLVLTHWDSKCMLFAVSDDGVITYIDEYASLKHLVEKQPGFGIIDPSNANERYLPTYCVKPL